MSLRFEHLRTCNWPAVSADWSTCPAGTGRLNGQSEKLLGKFISELPGGSRQQDSIAVATKIAPYPWRLTAGQFANACRHDTVQTGSFMQPP